MTLTSLTHSRPAHGHGLLRAAADVLRSLSQEWSYRRASAALYELDDSVLHDIGVARGDIDAAVRHGRAGLAS